MTNKTVAAVPHHQDAGAALERARDILATLERDHAAAVARQQELSKTRERLALAGLSGGSARDQRDLASATEEAGRIHLAVENFGFAIKGQRAEVAAAEAAVDREYARAKIMAALELVGDLRAAGQRCTETMTAFLEGYDEITEISNRIRKLGARWPSREQYNLSVRRSLEHHLHRRGLQTEPLITAVAGRRELGGILEHWIAELEISLERQLEEPGDDGRPPGPPLIEGEQFLEPDDAQAAE